MKDYMHIDRIENQDGGISNVFLRENRHVVIEITKLEEKFRAEIYHQYTGDPKDEPKKKHKSLIYKLYDDNDKDLLLNAIGWVDEHPGKFVQETDTKIEE